MQTLNERLRQIPKVDVLLETIQKEFQYDLDGDFVKDMIQHALSQLRKDLISGEAQTVDTEQLIAIIVTQIKQTQQHRMKRVINGTGIVIHTNLGRSVLSKTSIRHLVDTMMHYNNLEFDLDKGRRGSRYAHIESLLCQLTHAESALVVNNNAAAVMLILSTFAKEKEVIISRGELVEIGGSFRIPEVMKASGAKLIEVGSTNKTHLKDFQDAISNDTGMILKVHTSNYEIIGFTHTVERTELSELCQEHDIIFYEDLGSGELLDLSPFGIKREPSIIECLNSGVDLLSFSGDKLLGASQAGIIVGKKKYIDALKKNQLLRALRVDKLSLAVLEDTLMLYLSEERAIEHIPTLNMLSLQADDILEKVNHFIKCNQNRLDLLGMRYTIESVQSTVGGGALPGEILPSYGLCLRGDLNLNTVQYLLRMHEIPVVGKIQEDALVFDFRTIFDDDFEALMDALEFAIIGERYE